MVLKFFDLSAPYTVSFLKVFRAPASSKHPNTKKMIKKKAVQMDGQLENNSNGKKEGIECVSKPE